MDDLSQFCCRNSRCTDYGQRGLNNLRVGYRYQPSQRRVLVCRTCQEKFSETRGSVLYDSRLPEEKVISILQHLEEGCGIRQTARLVGVHKNTVSRLQRVAGEHARQSHDELVAFSPSDP